MEGIPEGSDLNRVLFNRVLETFTLDDETIAAQSSGCGITTLRDLRQAIVEGRIYADVHSLANPSGEIGGQVSFYGEDTDEDGLIDRRDPDIDGDGIANEDDDTPYNPSPLGGSAPPTVLVEEFYTDIPWHQKLSTKDSNLIDIPMVMPFDAIAFKDAKCKAANMTAKEKARCMLQYGIVNVMGMERTDTLYDSGKAPANCPDTNKDCVEVKLKVQRFHSNTTNSEGYEADEIRNNPGMAINKNETDPKKKDVIIPSLGYAITEATMFVPWLSPWPIGHYCAKGYDDVHDAVCYEDYFTTMIQATGKPEQAWLEEVPAVFIPHGEKGIFTNFCKADEFSCDPLSWESQLAEKWVRLGGGADGPREPSLYTKV